MASALAIERLHKLIWALIYSGLFTGLLGFLVRRDSAALGWAMLVAGGCLVVAGVVLIWVRSRLHERTDNPSTPQP